MPQEQPADCSSHDGGLVCLWAMLRALSLALLALWLILWGVYGAIGSWAGWLAGIGCGLWTLTLFEPRRKMHADG